MSGVLQLAEVVYGFGMYLGDSSDVPVWNPHAEFHTVRPVTARPDR